MVKLQKDQKFQLGGSKFGIALAWDRAASDVDLDLQAVAFDGNGKMLDAVYYNNLKALGKGLTHSGDEVTGEKCGFDEVVWAHLERLGSGAELVLYVLAAHSGHLKDANNGQFHLLEDSNDRIVGSFALEKSTEEVDLVGALVREGNGWVFRIVESPAQDGQHFMDILEPTIGNFVRSVIPGAPQRIKAAFAMEKGSLVDLPRTSSLGCVNAALGWDTSRGQVDLDVSAVVVDKSNNVFDAIFFGNQSGYGLKHSGDNLTGKGDGDDEVISVDLTKVPANVQQILFVINIYTNNRNFSLVANPYCRVLSANSGDELCRYKLSEAGDKQGLIISRLFRDPAGARWGFQALGMPCNGKTWKDSLPAINEQAQLGVRDLQKSQTFAAEVGGGAPAAKEVPASQEEPDGCCVVH